LTGDDEGGRVGRRVELHFGGEMLFFASGQKKNRRGTGRESVLVSRKESENERSEGWEEKRCGW